MKKILIIEDEYRLLRALRDKLEREGYKSLTALTGEEGLNMIFEEKPDLILLDIILPKIQGDEVMKKMKKDPEIAKIPVIIITNSGDPEQVAKFKKLGAIDYLVKADFKITEVMEKIKNVLK